MVHLCQAYRMEHVHSEHRLIDSLEANALLPSMTNKRKQEFVYQTSQHMTTLVARFKSRVEEEKDKMHMNYGAGPAVR
jgi:hypothetical protein